MKLMVVEDEKVIRNGLLKHVPWQKRFIRTSFFLTSGCQACPE